MSFFYIGDQDCHVTGSSACQFVGQFPRKYLLEAMDDVHNTQPLARPKVIFFVVSLGQLRQFLQRRNMTFGQIADMQVVSDACPVGGVVVCAVHKELRFVPEDDLDDVREQVVREH